MSTVSERQPTSAAGSAGTAERVARIIEAASLDRDLGVRELSSKLGLSRSAVHRIVQALSSASVLHALPNGRYRTGARLVAWANLLERAPVLAPVTSEMRKLWTRTGHTVRMLGYRPGDERAYVFAGGDAKTRLRHGAGVGSSIPLAGSAAGLAIATAIESSSAMAGPRSEGFSTSPGSPTGAPAGVAAAYHDDGALAGAVELILPADSAAEVDFDHYGALVQEAAHAISATLEPRTRPDLRPSPAIAQCSSSRNVLRVVHALDIAIRAAAVRGEVHPHDLAAALGAGRGTCVATLAALDAERLLRTTAGDCYEPGVKLLALPALIPDHGVVDVARDLLDDTVSATGESVYLITYDRHRQEARFASASFATHSLQYTVEIGSVTPLHAGASGQAILANLERTVRSGPSGLGTYSELTVTDPAELERRLEEIRAAGYAHSVGEHIPGVAGVAAPYEVDGAVAGAISIAFPQSRLDQHTIPELAAAARRAAQSLTELLSMGSGRLAPDFNRLAGAS